jgi:hypothetical protein
VYDATVDPTDPLEYIARASRLATTMGPAGKRTRGSASAADLAASAEDAPLQPIEIQSEKAKRSGSHRDIGPGD